MTKTGRALRVEMKLLLLQLIFFSLISLFWCQSLCTGVQSFGQETGVVTAVGRITNSIGYSGVSGVLQDILINTTGEACRIKMAVLTNKAGVTVQATIESAQSAVRSRANDLLFQSACPGFGMCTDVMDAEDYDAWPITAMTVSCSRISAQSQEQRFP
jgi:ABC-type phosphate transport system substrate-binding protein